MSTPSDGPGGGGGTRALLWLLAGSVVFVVGVVATAPELVGADAPVLADTLGLVGLAAIPGLVLLGVAVARRRRLGDDRQGRSGGAGHG